MVEQNIEIKNQEILDYLGQMNAPVPGQSLTRDPENPAPYEQPPKYTDIKKALFGLFEIMTEPQMYTEIVTALKDGMPVVNLTETLLTDGFQKGAWNPDLMVQLIEPTMYMVMSMAEKAGVKYSIDDDDDPDILEADGETEKQFLTEFEKAINTKSKSIDKNVLPTDIKEELKNVEVPSLLEKKETDSLLAPTEGVI
jgi:hypothetical protein